MRVVLINDASTARGGATGLALKLIEAFVSRGISVTWFAGDDGSLEKGISDNVEVISLGELPFLMRKSMAPYIAGLYNKNAGRLIRKWIKKNDNESTIYHVHGWSQVLSPSILRELRVVKKRTIYHAHDYFLVCPNGGYMDYQSMTTCNRKPLSFDCIATNCDKRSYAHKLWRVLRQLIVWQFIRRKSTDNKVILLHGSMAEKFVDAGWVPESLESVTNPAIAYSNSRIECERNLNFFFVGRLVAEKGVEDAIVACQKVGVVIEVIGDGPLRIELERKYRGVIFHGWCDRLQITRKLNYARAVIMSSRYPEPYGLVAAEASLSGLQVILSDSALLSHEISEHGLGIKYMSNDIDSLSKAVLDVKNMSSEDMKAVSELAYSGRCKIANEPDDWVEALLKIYKLRIVSARET